VVLPLIGERQSRPLIKTAFSEGAADISPDGRWLAYHSDESGRFEVYVRPFPGVDDGKWQVSTAGGTMPVWSPAGGELFYAAPDGAITVVRVTSGSTWSSEAPATLFSGPYLGLAGGRTFDVSLDGQRFLMLKNVETGDDSRAAIVIVQHFAERLKQLLPVD
jgi:serine/threonine-protein kinase